MRKFYKYALGLLAFVSFVSIATSAIGASSGYSSSSSDSEVSGALLGGYLAFIIIYYCLICLLIIAQLIHFILSILCLIDIAKRPNENFNKDLWIIGILAPPITVIGVFLSVGIEIYYLFNYRNKLQKPTL